MIHAVGLLEKHCAPCESVPLLGSAEIETYAKEVLEWKVVENKKLKKEFRFKDFSAAMGFVNQVATIAEAEGHHPNISIFYSRVALELWTHGAGGLTENDFILAAKINGV